MPYRMHAHARLAAIAAIGGSVLLSQGCKSDTPTPSPAASTTTATPPAAPNTTAPASDPSPTSPSTTTSTPGGSGSSGTSPILRGQRQVVIRPVESFESVLAVDSKGRFTLTDGAEGQSLFVLFPVGNGRHQIKTAKAQSGPEPDCMGLHSNGSSATTVEAAPCDVSARGQLFVVESTRFKDAQGRTAHTIKTGDGLHLRTSSSGLIAEKVGTPGADTRFTFIDNGPSKLPQLGD